MLYFAYMTLAFLKFVFHGVGLAFYSVGNVLDFMAGRVAGRIDRKINPDGPPPPAPTLVQASFSTPSADLN